MPRLHPIVWALVAVAVGFFIWLAVSLGSNDPCDMRGNEDISEECDLSAAQFTSA